MIHTILRNLQKAFFLSAAVLMLFAFNQLKHFDVEYFSATGGPMTAGGELHHPSYLLQSGSSEEDESSSSNHFRIGSSHQLMFGKEIKVGLFRFVLPRLELTTTPSPEQYQQQSSSSSSSSSRPLLKDSKEAVLRKKKKKTFNTTTKHVTPAAVIFAVDFREYDELLCFEALHEAQILRQSFLVASSDTVDEPWKLLLPRNCVKLAMSSKGKRLASGYRLAFATKKQASKFRNNETEEVCWAADVSTKSKSKEDLLVKIPRGVFFEGNQTTGVDIENLLNEQQSVQGNTTETISPSSNSSLSNDSRLLVEWLHVDEAVRAEKNNRTSCGSAEMRLCEVGVDCDEQLFFLPRNVVLRSWSSPSCPPLTKSDCGMVATEGRSIERQNTDETNQCGYILERYCSLVKAAAASRN